MYFALEYLSLPQPSSLPNFNAICPDTKDNPLEQSLIDENFLLVICFKEVELYIETR